MNEEILLSNEILQKNFNTTIQQKKINTSNSFFVIIIMVLFNIVTLNKFHLEYPIGRGGFGKVNHSKLNIIL